MLTELAIAGGIAVAAVYFARRSLALGRGFVEITLLFHFLLLLNGTVYAELPPALAWLQWIVPAAVILAGRILNLQKRMTRSGHSIATVAGLGFAECVVALLFYLAVKPALPF